MRRTVHTATAVLLLAGAAAAHANTGTPSTQTLFARQTGCGNAQEAGRLETKKGADTADGCGAIGGIPVNELLGADPETFSTLDTYKPVQLRAGDVVGQVAAASWIGTVGGVGTVVADVALSGLDAAGEPVDLGSTTVTAPASPTAARVKIPFTLKVPDEAVGALTGVSLSVTLRGQNVNANAQALNGDVFVTLPVLKP